MSDRETDPRIVQMLDQETEAFNNALDSFEKTFGFDHFCTCASDYTEGNITEITDCFGRLADEAMEACALMKRELEGYKTMAAFLLDYLESQKKETDAGDDS